MVAAAIVGSAVVGAAGAGIAASSSARSARGATAASERSAATQASIAKENLAFQKAQYADWQDVYGPIQNNLSEFFQGLTPDALIASGLKDYELQYQAVDEQIQRSFAQRGVDSSVQDSLNQQASLRSAEFKAKLRTDAPLRVATAKQGFLDHQATNPATAGISNAFTNQSNVYGSLADRQQSTADQYNADAAAGYQGVGKALSGGVQSYTKYQQYQNLNSTPTPDLIV